MKSSLVGLALLCCSLPSWAQSPTVPDPQTEAPSDDTASPTDPAEVGTATEPEGDVTTPPAETSPCRSADQPPSQWLDRLQLGVYHTVCGSAHWFDSFFGSVQDSSADSSTYGRLSLNLQYDSIRGLEPKLRLRAQINLPRFENRLQAIVGRTDEEELLRDEATEFRNFTPSLRDTEDEWLLGLGYSPFRGSKRQLDFTGGLNVRFPLDPFVAARYRRYFVVGDSTLVRARQTLFWRNAKGAGVSTRLDVDHVWNENVLMRWTTGATHAEETLGIDWRTSLTLFHNLRPGEAAAYQINWLGETDAPVTLEEIGLQAIYRRRTLRDWFFLQVSPGVVWRRESPLEARKAVPVIGFGFEMLFGQFPN